MRLSVNEDWGNSVQGPIAAHLGFMDAAVVDEVDEFRSVRQGASTAVRSVLAAIATAGDDGMLNHICSGAFFVRSFALPSLTKNDDDDDDDDDVENNE